MSVHALIYEPIFWGGHNFTYVRHLLRTLAGWPVRLTVVTGRDARASDAYRTQLLPVLDSPHTVHDAVAPAVRGADWGRHYYEALVDAIDVLRPDVVFLPTGDIVAAYAGSRRMRGMLRRPRRAPEVYCNVITGCYKGGIPLRQKPQRLRTSIYTSHAPWTRLFTVDPCVTAGHPPWRWLHGPLRPEVLPDPLDTLVVTTKAAARQALGLPADDLVVGCVGTFASHHRKNPLGLIQGFLASTVKADGVVALLGEMPPEVPRFVDSLGPDRRHVRIVDRFLSSEEMQLAVAALDLVCVPYRDFHQPSGIVLYAAALGRPVLAPQTGWFQDMIPRFELGWTADLSTPARIASALQLFRPRWETFEPGASSRALAAFLHWENYGAVFCRDLRCRLDLPSAHNEISWASVLEAARQNGR